MATFVSREAAVLQHERAWLEEGVEEKGKGEAEEEFRYRRRWMVVVEDA